MLDIAFIRENAATVKETIARRRLHVDIDLLLSLDTQKKTLQQEIDELRKERNIVSATLASTERTEKTKEQARLLKQSIAEKEESLRGISSEFLTILSQVPNLLAPDVPKGDDDGKNLVLKTWGTPPTFSFTPKDHVALGELNDWLDFDAGTKVAGSKFYFLKNDAVRLQYALIQFGLSILSKKGFTPVITPELAKNSILEGAGYNPRGPEEQIYTLEGDELSMIATAEITLNGMYADETIDEAKLPIKLAGISNCYRKEAGSWGRFSKGLYRVHHFTKLEMFIFCTPETSEAMHKEILAIEEEILQALELPYQVVAICDGDMGAVAYKKYDLEAWMPGRGDAGAYGEITSCSNCTDYQARNLHIQYKQKDGSKALVHTLNGTAIALSRTLLALMENNQQQDGSIKIPSVLKPYLL